MRANTAACFLLAGLSLALSRRAAASHVRAAIGEAFGVVVALIATATIAESLTATNWGIDRLLYFRSLPCDADVRMPVITALAFVLLGLALALRHRGRARRTSEVLASGMALLTSVPLLGFVYGISPAHVGGRFAAMTPGAAATFILLCAGFFLSSPELRRSMPLSGSDPESAALRRMLVATFVWPAIGGWALVGGVRAGLYDVAFGTAALVTLGFAMFTVLILRNARDLDGLRRVRQAAESQYHDLIECMPDGILAIDQRGLIRVANAALEQLFGHSRTELIGQPLETLLPARFRARHVAHLVAYQEHPRRRTMGADLDLWALRKDGREFPIDVSLSPVQILGEPMAIAAVRDVSERRQAKHALQESEQRYRTVVQTIDEIVYVIEVTSDPFAGRVVFVSDRAERTTGHSPQEFLENPQLWSSLIHPDDRSSVASLTNQMFRERTAVTRRYRLRHKRTDRYRWVEDRVVPRVEPTSGHVMLFGVARDITDTVLVTEALANKTQELETITDAMSAYLAGGSTQDASRGLVRGALDQTQSEYGFIGVVVDGPVLRILAHEGIVWSETENREFYEQALRASGEKGYLEFRNFNNLFGQVVTTGHAVLSNEPANDPRAGGLPRGHPPLKSFLGVPMVSGRTDVVGIMAVANRPGGYTVQEQAALERLAHAAGVLYDSYHRHEREAALERQLRESQRMDAIGRLAGGIAHDFNNMLTVILGLSDLRLGSAALDAPSRADLEEIRKAGKRAAVLTRQLLAFSRRQVIQPLVLDMNAAVKAMEQFLHRLIGEDIEFVLTLAPGEARAKMDPGQLEQVLANLVINARDAMPQGGAITMETAIVQLDALGGGRFAFAPGRYVRLSVTDTGTGIDEETLAHIFEPFFTTKAMGQGTGLGLSTVYGIVKQAEGFIDVDSEPGRTTFTIYLPWTGEALASREDAPGAVRGSLQDLTILVAEDDAAVRELLRRTLVAEGCRVLEAENGVQAMALLAQRERAVDLVLTDVVMPSMGGRSLADEVTQLYPMVKVLFMSGYPSTLISQYGVLGADMAFLEKPFTPQGLKAKVLETLR